jgi:cell division protein FtsB
MPLKDRALLEEINRKLDAIMHHFDIHVDQPHDSSSDNEQQNDKKRKRKAQNENLPKEKEKEKEKEEQLKSPTASELLIPKKAMDLEMDTLSLPPPASSATLSSSSMSDADAEALVGKRIKVYWPQDDAYYTGKIKKFNRGSRKHVVSYDDGDEEVLYLPKEKYSLI